MSRRVNLILADIFGWLLLSFMVFVVVALLLDRIDIATMLASEGVLIILAWLVGTYERSLRKLLYPEETARLEEIVRGKS